MNLAATSTSVSLPGPVIAVLVVVAVLGIGIAAYVSNLNKKKRQAAFAAWAAAHGFSYATEDEQYADPPWGAPFGHGSDRRANDVLTGTVNDKAAVAFTHHYRVTTGSGKDRQTSDYYHRVFALTLPKRLPELQVGTEGFLSTIARAVGVHDIEFESEDFNRQYKVQADDRKFASDVINPQMMQLLMDNQAPGFHIIDGRILYVESGRVELTEVESKLQYLDVLVGNIPPFVWDAH